MNDLYTSTMNSRMQVVQAETQKNESIRREYDKKVSDILTGTETSTLLKTTANNGRLRLEIFKLVHAMDDMFYSPETNIKQYEQDLLKYEKDLLKSNETLQQCRTLKDVSRKINRHGTLPAYLDYEEHITLHSPVDTRHVQCSLSFDWSFISLCKLNTHRAIGKVF